MLTLGIKALSEEEQDEFLTLQSFEFTQESIFDAGARWWRLGELHSKMNQPTMAQTYFTKAINSHVAILQQNVSDIDSWSLLARCFQDGIVIEANPELAKTCLSNIESIQSQNPLLDTKPLNVLSEHFKILLKNAASVLSYYDLNSRRAALEKFVNSDDDEVKATKKRTAFL